MSRSTTFRFMDLLGFAALAAATAHAGDFRISGPFTHDNLAIYLLHGSGGKTGKKLLTLQEAMGQQKVVVFETGQVNELSIENRSDEQVYIQSGDIVKGGQQDRVISKDMVLPPYSGKLPISSFCVERGRWTKRGNEDVQQFNASNMMVPSKALKVAVRDEKDQQKVWAEVARAQTGLSAGVGGGWGGGVGGGVPGGVAESVLVSASPTSMQLALENKKVTAATEAYLKKLSNIVDGKSDVVGYAYAINGKVNSAEVYASHDLFVRMWPKMLRASAAEALADRSNAKPAVIPGKVAVEKTLADGDRGKEISVDTTGRLSIVKKASDSMILFESRDRDLGKEWIHRSYIAK